MKRLFVVALAASGLFAQNPIRGFPQQQWKSRQEFEAKLRSYADAAKVRAYAERMSSQPHAAGSPASKAVAQYALSLMKDWGLEARIEEFEALMPYPTVRVLEMTAPTKYRAKLQEPPVAEDRNSRDAGQLPTYNSYSASGDVTGQVVYVNYGVPEDYEQLKKMGIDVKGKIVLARYGHSWRGTKPKVAQEQGAIGCLIYSDPRDDGYFQGDVYPKGAYRPPAGVQRGSVMDMPLYVGDPLSPGWASEKGSKRLKREEAQSIMKIPVIPISYEDAQPLLANLNGPVVPEPWRGALPLTYHAGPGPATAHLKLDFDWTTKPLYDVVATIPGSDESGQLVIYGNHHDAWVNGASDPVSGASALLETARILAQSYKQGWRPKRTIKLALWDGEEFGLLGSTEWAEKHQDELRDKAVLYINSDANGKGSLSAGGSSTLEQFVREVARDVADPVSGKSLLDSARARRRRDEPAPAVPKDNEFRLGALGAGSDYVAFVHHLGVAGLNLGFSGDGGGGVYHSIYDSFYWYTHFSDGDFQYGKALAQTMAVSLARMADAPVLPFEFTGLTRAVREYLAEIRKSAGQNSSRLQVALIETELASIDTAAHAYEAALAKAVAAPAATGTGMEKVNQSIFLTERAMTSGGGLPGRDWYRNRISAPGMYTGYSAKTLPGIREAVEAGRWDEANSEAAALAKVLGTFREAIRQATSELEAVGR